MKITASMVRWHGGSKHFAILSFSALLPRYSLAAKGKWWDFEMTFCRSSSWPNGGQRALTPWFVRLSRDVQPEPEPSTEFLQMTSIFPPGGDDENMYFPPHLYFLVLEIRSEVLFLFQSSHSLLPCEQVRCWQSSEISTLPLPPGTKSFSGPTAFLR